MAKTLAQQNDELSAENESLKAKISDLETTIATKDQSLADAQKASDESIASLKGDIDRLTAEGKAKDEEIGKLKGDVEFSKKTSKEDFDKAVAARAAEIVASQGGPVIEIKPAELPAKAKVSDEKLTPRQRVRAAFKDQISKHKTS